MLVKQKKNRYHTYDLGTTDEALEDVEMPRAKLQNGVETPTSCLKTFTKRLGGIRDLHSRMHPQFKRLGSGQDVTILAAVIERVARKISFVVIEVSDYK